MMVFLCYHTEHHVIRFFFFSSRRRHTISTRDWSSDVCSSDLECPRFEFGQPGGEDCRADALELRERLLVAPPLEQRVRSCESPFDPASLVGGDAVREVTGIDAEP